MTETNLKKNVEAFLKDEYQVSSVDFEIKINDAIGKDDNIRRLIHDSVFENDYDLKN